MTTAREAVVVRTFVELADTLAEDFDVLEMLTLVTDRCVDVLAADGAGLLLAASEGDLRLMVSSDERVRGVESVAVRTRQGPCFDCYEFGREEAIPAFEPLRSEWPDFVDAAVGAGFASAVALPLRLRGTAVGTLTLFSAAPGGVADEDRAVAQAFADVAAISVLHHRAAVHQNVVNDQLQHALTSRVVLEQAKGMLAERYGVDVETAFRALRAYARNANRRLGDVAASVVAGTVVIQISSGLSNMG